MAYDLETIVNLFLDYGEEHDDPYDFLWRFARNHKSEGWHFDCGETRCVIYHRSWDYVIKVDRNFNCQYYCAAELRNYQKAQEYRVQQVLLPISKVCEVNGWKLYRQTRFDCQYANKSYKHRQLQKQCEEVKRNERVLRYLHENLDRLDYNWLARVVQLYGKRFATSLSAWARECEVSDLHCNNIGFLKGKPIILDYAGYFGNDGTPSWAAEVAEKF